MKFPLCDFGFLWCCGPFSSEPAFPPEQFLRRPLVPLLWQSVFMVYLDVELMYEFWLRLVTPPEDLPCSLATHYPQCLLSLFGPFLLHLPSWNLGVCGLVTPVVPPASPSPPPPPFLACCSACLSQSVQVWSCCRPLLQKAHSNLFLLVGEGFKNIRPGAPG